MPTTLQTIAVVIPTYNAERFIERTLKNVALQTRRPSEIVVVDDGSRDRTVEIVRSLGVHVITQGNGGVASARNRGAAAVRSDWIAFLDADDLWHPTKLERELRLAGEDERIEAIVTDYDRIDEAGNILTAASISRLSHVTALKQSRGDGTSVFDRASLAESLAMWCFLLPSAFTIRTSTFHRLGGFLESVNQEDVELFVRCAGVATIAFLELPMVGYVTHPAQATASGSRAAAHFALARHVLANRAAYPRSAVDAFEVIWPSLALHQIGRSGRSLDDARLIASMLRYALTARFARYALLRSLSRFWPTRALLSHMPATANALRRLPRADERTRSSVDWSAIVAASSAT